MIPGKSYFPPKEYHRCIALSLLCSEWKEVGHTTLNHQETFRAIFIAKLSISNRNHIRSSANEMNAELISTPRLNVLPRLHLEPINLVVFQEFMMPNLGRGFALRCFQRLSRPNIATRHFTW